jgi:gliding motility-associated protein GldC
VFALFGLRLSFAAMHKSYITVEVTLDEQKVPAHIQWAASNSTAEDGQPAKAMIMGFWDGADKSALRIDLWTKEMMVDEMADFYYQHMLGMADSFQRSTGNAGLTNDLKVFAKAFYEKFRRDQEEKNKIG